MKKKIRKMLLKKYAVIVLLAALSLLYLYLGDWIFGYGLDNISYIMNYLLYSASEKLVALLMLLSLVIPDAVYFIRGAQPGRGAEK
ncbi:hypothetical protein [Paenibacillus jilunlii]|uniref:Uncharacterized protein n=1 Tax=Paenibacillus jilunlii TaxID=682956 RepID=A0A1G9GXG7_9BACL|nr:hypothetical protein [Paenibacillus jilunlii]KWX73952.1 hypothetical protein AML91_17040 [Paenibacillus jilunlii]SDL05410.1 hypothetical protein SAMN05216191_101612 [Paenibacillus jilunlii]